jgi:hypothetical protein
MNRAPAHEALGLRFDRLSPAAYAALAFSLAALWLLGRSYAGISHDASIYVAQGLRRLDPGTFGKDLFFAHGAQDSYTAFPFLYAPLIDALGASGAAMAVTVIGQIGFVAAATALVFRIVSGPARWWSLALLAVESGYYGGVGVFRLAEPFATARTLAEPLVLVALACALANRGWIAFAALAVAMALHPLVAVPAIAALLLWQAWERQCVLWLVALAMASVAISAAVWPGFAMHLDPPWLAAVQERSPHLFIVQWLLPDWSRFLWGLCVLGIAARFVAAPARRLVLAAAAVGLAGVAASWITVDLLDNALAAGLQLWRAHWLMHFLSIALVPTAVVGLWRTGNAARIASACIAASCCFGRAELPAAAVLAVLAVILDASERHWPGCMGERAFRLVLVAVLCAASVGLLFEVQSRLPPAYGAFRSPDWLDYVHAAASVGGLVPLALLLWLASYSRFAFAAMSTAAAIFGLSIAAWDARAPWPRFIEQASGAENPFRNALPPGVQVFWPGPHGRTWLVLGRPAWFSVDQGAGIVFNRETAIEYTRRRLASVDLQSAIENCAMVEQPSCRIESRPARELCERRDAPDYLVLNARIDGYATIEWPLPPAIGPGKQSLFLYSCRDLVRNEKGRREAGLSLPR